VNKVAGLAFSRRDGGDPEQGRPPLVLIHGAGGSRLYWPPEIRRLEGERVFGLDLPGHGLSEGKGEHTIEGYGLRVKEWMDAMGLDKAVLVGHSMGGAIALTMALQVPSRVAGLVLIGTGARLRVNPAVLDLTTNPQTFDKAVDTIIAWAFSRQASPRLVALARKRMAETPPQILHDDFRACDGYDVIDRLGEIAVPVQVICGRDDKLTPEKYSDFLAEGITGARLNLIDSAGHMVMLERPRDVIMILKEFIGRNFS
jgi:pimeloyl-ACP methyl ester carboxylesterase